MASRFQIITSMVVPSGFRLQNTTRWISVRRMSVRPEAKKPGAPATTRKKITIQKLNALRSQNIPITVLTAYDYPTGLRSERNDIDICLVGDSLAQVALGYDSTTRLTLDDMIHHCKAVSRAIKTPFLVADMPFGTYHFGPDEAVRNAVRLVREAGAEGVKLEGGVEIVEVVSRLVSLGIPTMAHVGLLPQRHTIHSGYRVQGRDADTALGVIRSAEALEKAGAFSVVLEAIPHSLATLITQRLQIPTIGIGAGPGCSGQVLVHDDAVGIWSGHKAKFVRRFAEVGQVATEGVRSYAQAVRNGEFPSAATEGYEMDEGEFDRLRGLLGHSDSLSSRGNARPSEGMPQPKQLATS